MRLCQGSSGSSRGSGLARKARLVGSSCNRSNQAFPQHRANGKQGQTVYQSDTQVIGGRNLPALDERGAESGKTHQ